MADEDVEVLEHIYGQDCRWDASKRSVSIRLEDRGLFGSGVWLKFGLPMGYPQEKASIDATSLGSRLNAERESLVVAAREALTGESATLYDAVVAANDVLADLAEEAETSSAVVEASIERETVVVDPCRLSRKLVYSHHIIADSKRAGLKELSLALGVTALVKIGWPGVIVLEGERTAVEAFVCVIQRWRWKHLVVRGEQEVDVEAGSGLDAARALPPRFFAEFGPSGMADLARTCREAGLEELFRRIFK